MKKKIFIIISISTFILLVFLFEFSGIQKSTRDLRRKMDMDEVAKALEVNYGNSLCPGVNVNLPYCALNTAGYILLANGTPINPKPGGTNYYFNGIDASTGAYFVVCALLETGAGNNNQSDGSSPNLDSNGSYYCRKND